MIVVNNRIPVAEGYEEQFEERFRQRAGMVEKAPGFVRFEVLRPVKADYYQIVTYWRDQASFEAWTQSQGFQQGHAQAKADAAQQDAAANRPAMEMFRGPNVLEISEVIQEAGKELA